ncbi:MAG: DUF2877 domain-containing protein [Actinobacteria bacterium]|nr:DUF2877 domain-containing protein [Actinomycetota bacterium]
MHRATGGSGAASTAVHAVLAGPARAVEVVASTPAAVYLRTGDPAAPALCLAAPTAVRVPCAVVLAEALPDRPLVGGGQAGLGRVAVAGFTVRVTRWWRPATPRLPAGLDHGRATAWLAGHTTDPLDAAGRATLGDLVGELTAPGHGDLAAVVGRLLGRGPGLTPVGDDVLAGLLVTLSAAGAPAAAMFTALTAAVRAAIAPPLAAGDGAAAARTTFVSAALLWHATNGECVPELAELLRCLADPTAREPAWRAATDRVLGVGHSSGAGLARGVRAGFAAAGSLAGASR